MSETCQKNMIEVETKCGSDIECLKKEFREDDKKLECLLNELVTIETNSVELGHPNRLRWR